MGRTKYDINLKPIAGTNHYQIRFTNKEAIDVFTKIGVTKGIYKENYVSHRLNEWAPVVNELVDSLKYSIELNRFSIKVEYTKKSDFEHSLTN